MSNVVRAYGRHTYFLVFAFGGGNTRFSYSRDGTAWTWEDFNTTHEIHKARVFTVEGKQLLFYTGGYSGFWVRRINE
jgi:hypothetical protein